MLPCASLGGVTRGSTMSGGPSEGLQRALVSSHMPRGIYIPKPWMELEESTVRNLRDTPRRFPTYLLQLSRPLSPSRDPVVRELLNYLYPRYTKLVCDMRLIPCHCISLDVQNRACQCERLTPSRHTSSVTKYRLCSLTSGRIYQD